MDIVAILIFLLIGAVAGWLAGQLMKGSGFGLLGNIIMGVIGSVVGGVLFSVLDIGGGDLIWQVISATVGAVVVILIVRAIR